MSPPTAPRAHEYDWLRRSKLRRGPSGDAQPVRSFSLRQRDRRVFPEVTRKSSLPARPQPRQPILPMILRQFPSALAWQQQTLASAVDQAANGPLPRHVPLHMPLSPDPKSAARLPPWNPNLPPRETDDGWLRSRDIHTGAAHIALDQAGNTHAKTCADRRRRSYSEPAPPR